MTLTARDADAVEAWACAAREYHKERGGRISLIDEEPDDGRR
jgi:hypothetical protein